MKINEKNLCAFATTPPFDCDGFLNKRGEVNKAFQRRYFVLKGNLLFYFEKKGDKDPLGLIIVEGCTIELSEENDHYCFEIAFNGNRTYVLSAESQDSMETWMKALTCAGYEYKKLMVAELQRQLEEIEESRNKILNESVMTSSAPRPPPRRQNPFNRPAPPLPGSSCNNTVAAAPFINGHFGSTAQRVHNSGNLRLAQEAVVENPTPHLGENNKEISKRQPQNQHHKICSASTVLSSQATDTGFRNRNAIDFELLHENFRQVIMKDVLQYRSLKEIKPQPLIQL